MGKQAEEGIDVFCIKYLNFIEKVGFTNQVDGPRIYFRDEGTHYVGKVLEICGMS